MNNLNIFKGLSELLNITNLTLLLGLAGLIGLSGITGLIIIIILLIYIIYLIYNKKIVFNISIKVEKDESNNYDNIKSQIINNNHENNWIFCFDKLKEVSRSFNIVIQQLDEELKNVICIFYLILRGLDTIEDDMSIENYKLSRENINLRNKITKLNLNLKDVEQELEEAEKELQRHEEEVEREKTVSESMSQDKKMIKAWEVFLSKKKLDGLILLSKKILTAQLIESMQNKE